MLYMKLHTTTALIKAAGNIFSSFILLIFELPYVRLICLFKYCRRELSFRTLEERYKLYLLCIHGLHSWKISGDFMMPYITHLLHAEPLFARLISGFILLRAERVLYLPRWHIYSAASYI